MITKCEACGSGKEIEFDGLLHCCKKCRAVPSTVHNKDVVERYAKKTYVVREPTKRGFVNGIRSQLAKFGMKTTGNDQLDRTMSITKKPNSWVGDPPDRCQLCDCEITDAFIDGVVAGAGWAFMCVSCHKKYGVGLGTGRGQHYAKTAEGVWEKLLL